MVFKTNSYAHLKVNKEVNRMPKKTEKIISNNTPPTSNKANPPTLKRIRNKRIINMIAIFLMWSVFIMKGGDTNFRHFFFSF